MKAARPERPALDYKAPNYGPILEYRRVLLEWLEERVAASEDGQFLRLLKGFYAMHPWEFVADWGWTFDPRNAERGLPTRIPMVPWPKQVEFLQWLYHLWRSGKRGLAEKSRDCGVTWLLVGFGVCEWCFVDGFSMGFGSRKEELVDHRGDEKAIFERIRRFIEPIPAPLLPEGFSLEDKACNAHMRIVAPGGNLLVGEAGDNIGRGGRFSIYAVDESAFIEHQDAVDSALSEATNCQVDVSTVNGSGNAFYRKRQRYEGKPDQLFVFDWKDDPRKDRAWYEGRKRALDPVIVAQEIDRDYNASQEDSFIPGAWVAAAIDAHVLLGFEPEGMRVAAFDPADTGDAKSCGCRHGSVITEADLKRDGDIRQAIPWAFELADAHRSQTLVYDGGGMGAPVMKTVFATKAAGRMQVIAFNGAASVVAPNEVYGYPGQRVGEVRRKMQQKRGEQALTENLRTNAEMFENFRAQAATWLRDRFKRTYDVIEAVRNGAKIVHADPGELISISSQCRKLGDLQAELSRPKRKWSGTGKILVESKQDMKKRGVQSPNLFDMAMMLFSVSGSDAAGVSRAPASRAPAQTYEVDEWRPHDPGVF